MRVIGLLAWYDEPPDMLADAVGSLAPHLDDLIALDGAYSYFPDGAPSSPRSQRAQIARATRGRCRVAAHAPRRVWVDEVEKRSMLFRLGERASATGDWLVIWDADMVLTRGDLRAELRGTERASAAFRLESSPASREMPVIRHTMAHRAVRGLTVIGRHSVYGYRRGEQVHYVWGHPDAPAPADLSKRVTVLHDPGRRPPSRLAAGQVADARRNRRESR